MIFFHINDESFMLNADECFLTFWFCSGVQNLSGRPLRDSRGLSSSNVDLYKAS